MDFPEKVALIEDEVFTQRIVEASLTRMRSCVLHKYANSAEALAGLAESRPDLMLVDLNLGDESGLDLLTALHAQQENWSAPAILVTAAEDMDWTKYKHLSIIGLLQKPFHPPELPDLIEGIWRAYHAK